MEENAAFNKFVEMMASFAEIKVVSALRDGFIMTTPLTIVGSIFLLLMNLPIPGYKEFMAANFGYDWTAPLYAVYGGTFSILGLVCCMCVAYKYTENEGCNAIMAAVLAFCTFVMVMPSTQMVSGEGVATDIIPKLWAGSNGIITGMIVAIYTGVVCCYCEKKHIGLKMPESVPPGVTRAFEALTPSAILFTSAALFYALCKMFNDMTFPQLIFYAIQSPLQSVTDSIIGGTIFSLLQTTLFWAGIHGPNVVNGVLMPIMTANALENQELIEAGVNLAEDPRAHILTMQVFDIFMKPAGCGATIGLLISGWLFAKSEQVRTIIKLGTVPGLFNINEPIIFGLPIVFNPYMIVPFSLAMLAAMLITYFAIALGFMSPFGAVQVPWTTPTIISGLLLQGLPGAIVQLIIAAVSTIIYMPFMKALDNAALKEEQEDIAEGY